MSDTLHEWGPRTNSVIGVRCERCFIVSMEPHQNTMCEAKASETERVTLQLDPDDFRDFNRAIAVYQRRNQHQDGGTLLPEGGSDLPGSVIGEICRDWLEARGELPQEGRATA